MILTVYIDVLFLVNFIINSLLITSTGFMLRFKTSVLRIASGAAVSAMYSVLMFFPEAHIMYTVSGRIIFTVLFVMLYFKKYKPKELLKALLAFMVNSLIFFGFIYVYSTYKSASDWLFSNGVPYAEINIKFLLLASAAAYIILYIYIKTADRNLSRRKIIYDAEFIIGDKKVYKKILCDTGCELSEPISGKPIILIEKSENIDFGPIQRYVNASTISGDTSEPIGLYKADSIKIYSSEVTVNKNRCYVGFTDAVFTNDGLYNGVANPNVFEVNNSKINFKRRAEQMTRELKTKIHKRNSKFYTINNIIISLSKLIAKFRKSKVYYIGGTDTLPAPFSKEEEAYWIGELSNPENAQTAGQKLTEHNLRLVVYIAKKFDSTGIGIEDLISIGTIGLMKAINTFKPEKNIKLATYASRCIENEILMYLRKNGNGKNEISIDEPLNVDWDGNELLLSDILGTDVDVTQKNLEEETDKELLKIAMNKLSWRERNIVELRFGINKTGEEKTQKEVADMLGISQSYISRLEKRIIGRLRRDMNRMING